MAFVLSKLDKELMYELAIDLAQKKDEYKQKDFDYALDILGGLVSCNRATNFDKACTMHIIKKLLSH